MTFAQIVAFNAPRSPQAAALSSRTFMQVILIIAVVFLAACTPEQAARVQAGQARVEQAVAQGCGMVNAAAAVAAPFAAVPQVGAILQFATESCGTAGAVSRMVTKAVNDPSTEAWLQRLAGQVGEAVAMVRGR